MFVGRKKITNGACRRADLELQMFNYLLMSNRITDAQGLHVSPPFGKHVLPAVLLGYVIMRNMKFKVGYPTPNGTEWREMESGFQIDYVKKKLYKYKSSVDEAIEQLKKFNPDDEYEAHPVYWYGR